MNENTIRKLVKLVEESDVDQVEISSWWKKIRITKRLSNFGGNGSAGNAPAVYNVAPPAVAPAPAPVQPAATSAVDSAPADADKNYIEVKSPMVGTFYAAPAPDAKPYVTQGQNVEVGQVICIVEAMKLMNEIESETAGRIAKIVVENAQPVEFGQVLYLIDPEG